MDTLLPKTLFIEIAYNFGGSGTRLLTLLNNLPREKVGLACLEGSQTAKNARELGIKTYIVGRNKFDPRIPWRLRNIVVREKYQVFDSQNINSKIWGALMAPWVDAAFVSTLNSNYLEEFENPAKRWMINTLEKVTNVHVKLFIAVSEGVRDHLIESGIPKEKIAIIRNSINPKLNRVSSEKSAIIQKFNLGENPLIGAAVGRLVWIKGFDILIESVKLLGSQFPNFKCFIIGEGSYASELNESIKKAELNNIIITGFLPLEEVYKILKCCDVFIMPSRTEGTPMALLEAAAFSLPIVASRTGGIPDVIANNEQGILVDNENAQALASAIAKVLQDPDLARRLGTQAAQRILEEFTPEIQAEKLTHAYLAALKNQRSSKTIV